MKQTSRPTKKAPAESVLKDIRRVARRRFSAEVGTTSLPVPGFPRQSWTCYRAIP